MSKTGRAIGIALAILTLALASSGCRPPDPAGAALALKDARAQEKAGKLEAALAGYSRAAQLDSNGSTAPEAYVKTGELALKLNKPDQAVNAYTTLQRSSLKGDIKTDEGVVHLPDDVDKLHDQAMAAADKAKSRNLSYRVMDFLVRLTGKNPAYSYWIAIFLFTGILKLILTPLTASQLRSSRKMMLIQPKLKEIQDRYRDRPDELNRRMMALYKEEGVNPLGCGSGMVFQMVIIFALYRLILDYQYQFTHGYFLWIGSPLSAAYPHIFAPSLAKPDMPLLLVYGISMFVQSKMTMVPTMDSNQAQQQKMMAYMMPLMLLVVLRFYPSAFTLYWLLYNIMNTFQQLRINKQLDAEMGARPLTAGDAPAANGDSAPKPLSNGASKKGPKSSGKKK
jgi:YidC/Oxa1 family membrane protein insertase